LVLLQEASLQVQHFCFLQSGSFRQLPLVTHQPRDQSQRLLPPYETEMSIW